MNGKELHRLEAHTPWPFSAAFAPDGKTLLTWGRRCTGWAIGPGCGDRVEG
jgi:hypothetical protein